MDETRTYTLRWPDGREFGPATMSLLTQWARERRVPIDGLLIPSDGSAAMPVRQCPELAAIVDVPMAAAPTPADEPLAGIIPYKNPHALIGYYTSIASLLPLVGLLAGPMAIVLGVLGLRRRRTDPKVRGAAHAWIAIILGSIGVLISIGCAGSIITMLILDSTNHRS